MPALSFERGTGIDPACTEVPYIPMFTRGRSRRAIAAIVIATALLASSFASTYAAIANIQIGGGDQVGHIGTGATPEQVSPGNVAGFFVWLHNADAANLSSFFLNTAATTATPVGAYWSHGLNGVSDGNWTTCNTTSGLKCSFGPFNSGTDIFLVAGFTLPTTESASMTNCLPTGSTAGVAADGNRSHVCVDFQFGSDSGFVVDKGKNKSRGDAYHWYDVVYTDTGANSAAQFPFCDPHDASCDLSLLSVTDSQTLGKNNPQWTQVHAPEGALGSAFGTTGIGVADGDKVSFTCPTTTTPNVCGTSFLGEFSSVDVNDGQDFADGDPWVQVDIGVYGVSANKISTIYHFYQINDTGPWYVEVIDTPCADSSGPTDSLGDPSFLNADRCFWVSSLKGSSSQVTIWTHHNGKFGIG